MWFARRATAPSARSFRPATCLGKFIWPPLPPAIPAATWSRSNWKAFLAGIETEMIERALRLSKGNKTKAAELLGLTRPRLYRRMVQLGLDQQDDP